jgi:glycosyltransferase involved in cell wall biosynthesis
MRVLAINQFYAPDHAATSQLLTELCEDLAAHGDEVTVIASRGSYLGGSKLRATEVRAGVRVVRPWATSLGKASVPRRLADYLSFWVTAVARAATVTRPEVILVLTTPPMIASGGVLVSAARRVPLVTWVQDIYPDIAVAFGVLPARHPAARGFALLQRETYRAARRVVALSAGMGARLTAEGAPEERVRVIPNWADGRAIRPLDHADNPFRREHDLDGRFVVMYSGNLGVGHDIATFIGAARLVATASPSVLFLFIGDGSRRAEAEELSRGLGNVRFLPYQPYGALRQSLSAADVHLISLREGLEGLLVPSKLYGALASGRPVLYIGPRACEVARVVREHDVGWEGRPGDTEGLARVIAAAAASPAWCAEGGSRARAIFEAEFDRPIAVERWRRVLEEACHPALA